MATAQNQQNQEPDCKMKPDEAVNLIWIIANVHASCLTPFMRRWFGVEAMGWHGLLAALLILGTASLSNDKGMLLYLAVWLIAVICQRARTLWLVYGKKVTMHSRYAGFPWLAMQVPFVRSEWLAACVIEPLICLAIGWILSTVSVVVGQFVMWGFVSLIAREGLERLAVSKRLQVMRDAEIEQRAMADRFRSR